MRRIPSAARYRAALAELCDVGVPESHKAMLRAHYEAGPRGLTAAELAKAAGYRSYHSANLQYGLLARRLREKLGVEPDASPNASVIETWDLDVRNRRGHLLFPMRTQVAQALEWLGLVTDHAVRHYVAYNKIADWGRVPEGGSTFKHWSSRSVTHLEQTIGQTVWVVSGERVGRNTIYKLCHVYKPIRIRADGNGYLVVGNGTGFRPHINVTRCAWLPHLLKEQNNFRYGLNQIKSRVVIDGLRRLQQEAPTDGFPDDISEPNRYPEGAVRQVIVNAYERNEHAREACIAHYGAKCVVCKFDFEAQYGELGAGVIHVHHVKPLSEIGRKYRVDPIKDLRPVCPNCHTMIHRRKAALSIIEARSLVKATFPWPHSET